MKKRADKIRIDAKTEKKAKEMKTEFLELKRTIKDLESLSEVERNASRRDPETNKILPRGELVRIDMELKREQKKYPNPTSIAGAACQCLSTSLADAHTPTSRAHLYVASYPSIHN